MNNSEVKSLVSQVFDIIQSAESTAKLEAIFDDPDMKIIKACRMDPESYPKLNFKITADELKSLEFINKDYSLHSSISTMELSPLTKLLYAVCWKNGDLKKVKHIIEGILSDENIKEEKEDGLVFYHFGKHLTKKPGEPIIDQHVLRAFAIFKNIDSDEQTLTQIRRKSLLNKNDLELINEYKKWLIQNLKNELKNADDYCYYIDQLLFGLGKAIKITAKSRPRKKNPVITSPNHN